MTFNFNKANSFLQEKLSSHPQVKFIPSESNIAESQLKSIDLEQPSPIFVSETLSKNETYSSGSGCFERLSAELEGKSTKLLLFLASPYFTIFSCLIIWLNYRTLVTTSASKNGISWYMRRGKCGSHAE